MSKSDPFFSRGDFMREMNKMKDDIRSLQTAQRGGISGDGVTTYLRDQDFRVIGGTIHVEDNGDIVIVGGQLVAGPTILDASGVRVGDNVFIDSDGLKIGGILQPALAVLTEAASSNPTVGTSITTVNEIEFTIPPWANEVSLIIIARAQNTNAPSGNWGFFNALVNDVGGLDASTDDFVRVESSGISINSSTVALSTSVLSPGSTVTCRQRLTTSGGTLNYETRLEGIAIVRRA